jgi:hypothetical protein
VATDENGRLEAIPTSSIMVSYQHFWTDRLWSHIVYSYGEEDNTAGQGVDAIETVEYGALNLVWELAEGISVGAEWLYGSREDNGGAAGEAAWQEGAGARSSAGRGHQRALLGGVALWWRALADRPGLGLHEAHAMTCGPPE